MLKWKVIRWSFQIESINCLYMNSASLSNKIDELRELSNTTNTHLKRISETCLSSQITDQELVKPDMSLSRKDRRTGMRGGLAFYL